MSQGSVMLDPQLLAAARTAIARLELVSNGTTVSYGDGGSATFESRPPRCGHTRAPRGKPDDPTPKMIGMVDPEFMVLRRRLDRCRTDRCVVEVTSTAERELERLSKSRPAKRLNVKQAVLTQFQTESAIEVARILGIHRTTVWRWRTAHGQSGETGEELVGDARRSWLTIGSADAA